MKLKKKMMGLVLALTVAVIGCGVQVSAETIWFDWIFTSTKGTLPAGAGHKNDMEQNYYLTILSGDVSTANIFGTRIRRASDEAAVSNYVTHTSKKQSARYPYATYVDNHTNYYMNGKKDSTSTTSSMLSVTGKVTY